MGLRTSLRNLGRPRRSIAGLASPLQLASTSWRHRRKAPDQQTRPNPEQPVEAPQLEGNSSPVENGKTAAPTPSDSSNIESLTIGKRIALFRASSKPVSAEEV